MKISEEWFEEEIPLFRRYDIEDRIHKKLLKKYQIQKCGRKHIFVKPVESLENYEVYSEEAWNALLHAEEPPFRDPVHRYALELITGYTFLSKKDRYAVKRRGNWWDPKGKGGEYEINNIATVNIAFRYFAVVYANSLKGRYTELWPEFYHFEMRNAFNDISADFLFCYKASEVEGESGTEGPDWQDIQWELERWDFERHIPEALEWLEKNVNPPIALTDVECELDCGLLSDHFYEMDDSVRSGDGETPEHYYKAVRSRYYEDIKVMTPCRYDMTRGIEQKRLPILGITKKRDGSYLLFHELSIKFPEVHEVIDQLNTRLCAEKEDILWECTILVDVFEKMKRVEEFEKRQYGFYYENGILHLIGADEALNLFYAKLKEVYASGNYQIREEEFGI